MHKNIVVFEIEGGSDKYFDGHRKDTMPIVNAIREAGWSAEVVEGRPVRLRLPELRRLHLPRKPGQHPGW